MKVGIMQPYFLPYIGYWQLIDSVDKYVIYDDVNYINRGWVNRNRILIDGSPMYFGISVARASQNKKISELKIDCTAKDITKKLRTVECAYRKAPYFEKAAPVVEQILTSGIENLASYIEYSIYVICEYLSIKTELIKSSSLKKECNLKGQDKIINICKLLGATEYYNAIGGQQLYSYKDFCEEGIVLKFLKTNDIVYRQFGDDFQKNLSILDVLMFNSKQEVSQMLKEYSLVD